jgi:hypothetical protein
MKTPLQVGPTLLALLAVWIFVTPSFAQEIETLQKGVVKIRPISLETSAQTGTGFIVRRGADVVYIITALHVVIGARDAEVEFFTQRNRLVQAKVLQQEGDDERGLAVLAVQGNIPTDVVVLKMNRGGLLRAGDPVTMIGFPDAGGPWAVTKGEIVGRKAKSIVFSGAIEKGNSGGPLIHEGQVIGVVTQTQSPFSYAAPTVIAQYVLESWGVKFGDQLRSKPATVEPGYVVQMIREKGFNHPGDMSKEGVSGYVRGNFQHEYEVKTFRGIKVVIDHATDLMWEQSGSGTRLARKETKGYIDTINGEGQAGFSDWRLPTVEELASLLEPIGENNGLYIDPVFDPRQSVCWSSDESAIALAVSQTYSSPTAWGVDYKRGTVFLAKQLVSSIEGYCTRAVRSMGSDSPGDGVDRLPEFPPHLSNTEIAFVSNREGTCDIYVMNADGTNPRRLTNSPEVERSPLWSPDGTKIAFVTASQSSPGDSYALNARDIYVVNPYPLNMEITIGRLNMPARHDVTIFGAVGDARRVADGVIRAASRDHLTSATAGFTEGDKGKQMCIEAAGPERSSLSTTITEVVSATEIRLADAASIAADLFDAQITWGTDDAGAVRDAATASGACSVFFPPGGYWLGSPVTFNVPVEFVPGASLLPRQDVTITMNEEILAPKDATIFDVTCGGAFKINWTGELTANRWSGGDMGARVNNLLASINLRQPRPLGRTARVRIVGDADLTTPIDMTNLRPVGGLVVTMEGRLLCKVGANQPAIDMVGSRGITAMNWSLYGYTTVHGNRTMKPGIGLLCARTPRPTTEPPDPDETPAEPASAGNHKFFNLQLAGDWTISPLYLIDSEGNYFQNLDIRTQFSLYGFFFSGTNVDGIVSPHLPIDDGSSQTNLHIDGLYLRATDVTKGGFYISGADRIHISGQTYIRTYRAPKIVLDMSVAGITGFWCDGLHGEGRPPDAIHVIGSGKRLTDVIIRSLRLGATENAIHIDASRPNQPPGHMGVRNAHFEFLDIEAFRCTGDIRMEQKVDIITRGDEEAPQIILGQDFNGEIWGGDVEKLHVASRLMTGRYHDGVSNVVHEFKYWPVLTFADVRDEHGEARPNIAGGLRFRTANIAHHHCQFPERPGGAGDHHPVR